MRTLLSLILSLTLFSCTGQGNLSNEKKKEISAILEQHWNDQAKKSDAKKLDSFSIISIEPISERRFIELSADRFLKRIKDSASTSEYERGQISYTKEKLAKATDAKQRQQLNEDLTKAEEGLKASIASAGKARYSLDSCQKAALAASPDKPHGYFAVIYARIETPSTKIRGIFKSFVTEDLKVKKYVSAEETAEYIDK